MKAEDLFLAIGQAEDRHLAQSELESVRPSNKKEEPTLKPHKTFARIIRNILVAALLLSLLTMTAYAIGGYILFDSPQDMMDHLFGDKTGYDHSEGSITPFEDGVNIIVEPTFDRVPADQNVVEEVAPHVSAVGQSITWNGYTLTVDANLYDSATQSGVLTLILENPNGIPKYEVFNNGEITFPGGELIQSSQYYKNYIIQENCTPTKLTIAHYYRYFETKQLINENPDLPESGPLPKVKDPSVDLTFTLWASVTLQESDALLAQATTEEERQAIMNSWECPEKIHISLNGEENLPHVSAYDGAVRISPIAICVEYTDMPFTADIEELTIGFKDGSSYAVKGKDYLENFLYAVETSKLDPHKPMIKAAYEDGQSYDQYNFLLDFHETTFMFNRMVDVDQVKSVTINGTEIPLDP